jgi:hypothetical protein
MLLLLLLLLLLLVLLLLLLLFLPSAIRALLVYPCQFGDQSSVLPFSCSD